MENTLPIQPQIEEPLRKIKDIAVLMAENGLYSLANELLSSQKTILSEISRFSDEIIKNVEECRKILEDK
jgi:hypothetical protein